MQRDARPCDDGSWPSRHGKCLVGEASKMPGRRTTMRGKRAQHPHRRITIVVRIKKFHLPNMSRGGLPKSSIIDDHFGGIALAVQHKRHERSSSAVKPRSKSRHAVAPCAGFLFIAGSREASLMFLKNQMLENIEEMKWYGGISCEAWRRAAKSL